MPATKAEIKSWFEEGLAQGAPYMFIVCDTFDWQDYPVYMINEEQARRAKTMYEKHGSGQRLMEIYDLQGSMTDQLNSAQAMAL